MKKGTAKQLAYFITILTISSSFSGCGCHQVGIGEVGVKTKQMGSSKGVDPHPYTTGWYGLSFGENMINIPVTQHQYVFTASTEEQSPINEQLEFQDMKGLQITADYGITAHILPEDAPYIYGKYKLPLGEIIKTFGKTHLRNSLKHYGSMYEIDQIYGDKAVEFNSNVENQVREELAEDRIIVDGVYALGVLRIPTSVSDAINAKMAAMQKADQLRNEVEQKQAEADKLEAEARGQKAKQELEASTLTPNLLRKMWIDKWDGHLPTTLTGSEVQMLLGTN